MTGQPLNVLIVDDCEIVRNLLASLVPSPIFRPWFAENGRQALAWLELQEFDIMSTDYNMPTMDGLELVAMVRGNSRHDGMPILMISSERNRAIHDQAIAYRNVHWLPKHAAMLSYQQALIASIDSAASERPNRNCAAA
ncbi:response regulator [Sphingomonas sp. SFZ2018-12]|uniref:response regulator n=1 Tax=Sphingomonas sp. SFZ2018-12 TaxID=2683197 RepID=UPI001F0E3933|nr:response regulator [Sphingomonas sp. SFZ2018-12]MCH4892546.1 response regulator [Sphingomonas sp. SFZ2018-12]